MNTQPSIPYILAGATGAIVASAIPLIIQPSKADTKLLPFQGRLTDATGSAIVDGAKVVEFKMYDSPTGGNVKWAGEVHKLSVNGGLVNTMLGSKAGLGSVDFSTPSFLQITVDSNADGQITDADPPLLPRQSVVSAVFAFEAGDARKLAGQTWGAILADGATDPSSGFINGAKVKTGSITTGQIGPDAIDSTKIANGSLKTEDMAPEMLRARRSC